MKKKNKANKNKGALIHDRKQIWWDQALWSRALLVGSKEEEEGENLQITFTLLKGLP